MKKMKTIDFAAIAKERPSVAGAISSCYGRLFARWISWRAHRSGFKFCLDSGAPATFYRFDNSRAEKVLVTYLSALHGDPIFRMVYGANFTVSPQHQKDGAVEVDIEGEKIWLVYLDFGSKMIFRNRPHKFLKSAFLLVLSADAVVFRNKLYSARNSWILKYAVEHNLKLEISALLGPE